jgi:hypothetical protein
MNYAQLIHGDIQIDIVWTANVLTDLELTGRDFDPSN